MFLIRNRLTDEIFVFDTTQSALKKAIEENKKDEDHPSFHLYKVPNTSGKKCKLLAELVRDFGQEQLYWKYY
jgi:hypothetical protein